MSPLRTLTLGLAIAAGALSAHAATITVDTVIDTELTMRPTILDGIDGPATVTLVEGGIVPGFEVEGGSHLIVDGGDVTLPVVLKNNATLTLFSGSLDCTNRLCAAISLVGIVEARDESHINIHSGQLRFPLSLFDISTVAFHGRNLSTRDVLGFTVVTGESLSGEDILVSVIVNDPGRITLNEIPEPTTLSGFLLLGAACLLRPCRTR